jgi:hypothetical protein
MTVPDSAAMMYWPGLKTFDVIRDVSNNKNNTREYNILHWFLSVT